MGKDKHKVRNWPEYNEGLKKRGSLSIWIDEDIALNWLHQGPKTRGSQHFYSETAIELCLTLRIVYGLTLRQVEGFMKDIFCDIKMPLDIPSYTTMCRRSKDLKVTLSAMNSGEVINIAADSTGLKVYGEGEWKVRKHGSGKHRTWMKMHICIDIQTQQVHAVTLTTNAVDDATEVASLLEQIKQPIQSFRGDGAYDKDKVMKTLDKRNIKPIIPPQHNAVIDKHKRKHRVHRDKAIQKIKEIGRDKWKKKVNYQQRSKAETLMFRYKTIISENLSARKIEHQKTEVALACKILNIMLSTAKPKSKKVA